MPFKLVEKQVLYTGKKLRLEIHHIEDEEHEGRRTQREIVVHNGSVAILPFLDERTILLIKNRRYAISQILLELPAGTLEKGEAPMNCAGRELLEETGYLATRMLPLFNFFTSPGIISEKMYAFAAYDLEKSHAACEVGEEIEVLSVPLSEAFEMIRTGEIQDGKTIATLLMFDRYFAGR
jgi:ADP-ribose pyrophosphatase